MGKEKDYLIYHITDIDNLPEIIKSGGLYSNNNTSKKGIKFKSIAHEGIQDRRGGTTVPISPNGNLHDYVPFYFAPRSPMLYVIKNGHVTGHLGGQAPIVYIVSSVKSIESLKIDFVFSDGHAIMSPLSKFYNDLGDMDKIDWKVMELKYWKDTKEDHDRKRRRQAEFLVKGFLPIDLVKEVGVYNEGMKSRALEIAKANGCRFTVKVKREWYY